ncbi:MAG: hypothetical protein HN704_03340 [Bacteroidetes bacterium]|jgi:hypothetical protein|nr:hypothetical protein [Bacteroidota bacterium]MBT6686564.1 hypothetical protein [Bacteroidota bacterium]MBT7142927.1 hypothetical protein [Bacteroidota bacterium]MBT7490624.1 hypothetical protein [Bacteroidota bacterium]
MINLLQENIEIESHCTNSTFGLPVCAGKHASTVLGGRKQPGSHMQEREKQLNKNMYLCN